MTPMTVAQLRGALVALPDDMPVLYQSGFGYWPLLHAEEEEEIFEEGKDDPFTALVLG